MVWAHPPKRGSRQAPPAPELGEGVLDLVQRPERGEAAHALRWRLDVELNVLALGQRRELRLRPVANDCPNRWQVRQTLVQEARPA